jgi:hypothetical protein
VRMVLICVVVLDDGWALRFYTRTLRCERSHESNATDSQKKRHVPIAQALQLKGCPARQSNVVCSGSSIHGMPDGQLPAATGRVQRCRVHV